MFGNSREIILGTIRKALAEHKVDMPFPEAEKAGDVFAQDGLSLEEKYAQEFSKLGGKFIYCANEQEMIQQLQALADTMKWERILTKDKILLNLFADNHIDLVQDAGDMNSIEVGLSLCECLVARTGSAIMSSGQEHGRALPVYSPIHITVAFSNQLVYNIGNAIDFLNQKYNHNLPSLISLTTGPSRTADIEKTLVVGVHGPKEVYTFLIDKMSE
jgi:L-lactate dehydrogenase complex protein LldG